MSEAIYLLCGLTSLACAVLLVRRYLYARGRLLLFGCIFFATQAVANALLYLDLVVIPQINFTPARTLVTLVGVAVLVFGLIWETT